jgi:DNA repair exonuclease SbcCD ATPase subunit
MPDEGAAVAPVYEVPQHQNNAAKWILLIVALLYVGGSLYFLLDYQSRLQKLEKSQSTSAAQITALQKRLSDAETSSDAIASEVGLTKRQLSEKTAELRSQQRAVESRLAKEQEEQISKVTGQVSAVSSEVGGVKTDVASTRTDLEATKARLESMRGDMGVMSGLIARNHDDVEELKRKGDRNYYEFTIQKSKTPQRVGPVQMSLNKADQKRSKYTMTVLADDKSIEKKDKTAGEPVQFYVKGTQHYAPYEIVVFDVGKNQVTGYLSTPKSAGAATAASNTSTQ